MNNFVILNSEQHKDLRISDNLPYQDMKNIKNCQIIADEIFMAGSSFPVFFLKDEKTGKFLLSAIFTFQNNGNLFVTQAGWDAPYMPLNIKRQPLAIGREVAAAQQHADDIYINPHSKLASVSTGSGLFNPDGSETAYLKNKKRLLGAVVRGEEKTGLLIDSLLKHDLMSALSITLSTGEGDKIIRGIYGIDHLKMTYMDQESCLGLINEATLEHIFMMKASYAQIGRLIWLENKRLWRENKDSKQKITNYSISCEHD